MKANGWGEEKLWQVQFWQMKNACFPRSHTFHAATSGSRSNDFSVQGNSMEEACGVQPILILTAGLNLIVIVHLFVVTDPPKISQLLDGFIFNVLRWCTKPSHTMNFLVAPDRRKELILCYATSLWNASGIIPKSCLRCSLFAWHFLFSAFSDFCLLPGVFETVGWNLSFHRGTRGIYITFSKMHYVFWTWTQTRPSLSLLS